MGPQAENRTRESPDSEPFASKILYQSAGLPQAIHLITFYQNPSCSYSGIFIALSLFKTMARIPRNLIIEEGLQTHKMWRSHNKDWNLESNDEKAFYLKRLNKLLPKQSNQLNSFSLMSNHSHEVYDIKNKVQFYNLMRDHHSLYGMFYNRKHDRRGRVAYDRPKTCCIESEEYSMRATFYIHANPLRAGITKNAANYPWSSHKLYAFGKRDKFTENIVFPKWYMDLGKTPEQRQRMYRKLFDAYLREAGLITQHFLDKNFYGSFLWTNSFIQKIKDLTKSKSPP